MGTLHQFVCPACHYSAEISGGDDAGMEILTTTVVCHDCRQLFDVQSGWSEPYTTRQSPIIGCPNSKTHRVSKWQAGGDCPRCGAIMEQKAETALWD